MNRREFLGAAASVLLPPTVAWARKGAKKLLHACLPHPGEEMFMWTSPGRRPSHQRVDRWPTGYETWVWRTSLGVADVVPDVKYNRLRSPAGVRVRDEFDLDGQDAAVVAFDDQVDLVVAVAAA